MMKVAVFLACIMAACASPKMIANLNNFYYDNCGPPLWPINLQYLSILPDPITVPGSATADITLVGDVGVVSPAPGEFIVTYHNTTTDTWDNVPCVDGPLFPVGSCNYADSCDILKAVYPDPTNCPQAFIDAGAPCNCPFNAGTIALTGVTLDVGTVLGSVLEGDYNFKFSLFNAGGGQDGCINIGVTFKPAA